MIRTSLWTAALLSITFTGVDARGQDRNSIISAKVDGRKIVLGDGRVLELQHKKVMMPFPELEMTAPAGAEVELFYDKRRVLSPEVPFVFKRAKVDQYIKMVVKEPSGTWSVKFKPKTQHRTLIVLAGGQPATAKTAPAPSPSKGGCKKTLLAKGHHAMHADNCKGVDDACAVAVLEAGHHPQHLSNCTTNLAARCVQTLLKKGHHPQHLSSCAGVEDDCAVTLLERGDHPMQLSNCSE